MNKLLLVVFSLVVLYGCGSDSGNTATAQSPNAPATTEYHWVIAVINHESIASEVVIFEGCGGTDDQINYMAAFSGWATDTEINCYADQGNYRYIKPFTH